MNSKREIEEFIKNVIVIKDGKCYYNRKPFNFVSDWIEIAGCDMHDVLATALAQREEKKIEEAVEFYKNILLSIHIMSDVIKPKKVIAHQKKLELYHELLMSVGNKHKGETRHETALRYIRSAEQSSCSQGIKTVIGEK